jgi:hypothetical protein
MLLAQAPRSPEEIKDFPGSVVDTALLSREKEAFDDSTTGMPGLLHKSLKVLSVSAPVDEVFRWYEKQLKAVENTGGGYDPAIAASGKTSPVQYDISYYEEEDFQNQYERDLLIVDGQWVKNSLAGRKREKNGRIVKNVRFVWEFMTSDGGRTEIDITIDDESLDLQKKSYQQKTSIMISCYTFSSETGVFEDSETGEDGAGEAGDYEG